MVDVDTASLFEEVAKCKNAIIVGHSHPDGDCVGSAVALASLIETLGGKAKVIFPEKAPKRLSFILEGRKELEILPENIDGFDIICTDVASQVQMASLRESIENSVKIRIDHHDIGASYAKYETVDASAAATAEMVFDLWEHAVASGYAKGITDEAKTAIYAAISSDTGCFKYANVTPATHIRAAKLIEMGTPAAKINQLLFDTKEPSQLKAEGIALSRIETFANGLISGIAIELSDYEDGLNIKDFETAIDFARCVRGAKCAVSVKASPTAGVFRASLRANCDIDVSKVAASFGGGGHIRAAGCSVEASSAKEALMMIVNELEKII